jgi:hypothetical protein
LSVIRDIHREFAAEHIDVKRPALCEHPVCQVDPLAFVFFHLSEQQLDKPGKEGPPVSGRGQKPLHHSRHRGRFGCLQSCQ